VAAVGEGWCFLINAVSYIAVIIGLLMMKVTPRPRRLHHSGVKSVVEGFRWVAHTGPIRALLLLLGVVSLTGMPFVVLMPIFADRVLHSGARGLGMLMAASGMGALTGTLLLATRRGVRGLGKWITFAVSGFGLALICFALSRWFVLSLAFLFPAGFAMMIEMASSNTLIQAMVPDELRGRVMAVYSMMFLGMAPFGALTAGAIAQHLGAPTAVAIGGVICLAGGITFGWAWRPLRSEARELVLAQAMAGGEPAEEMTGQELGLSGEKAAGT
jgi:predicted MFS family arabinose efflux permease